MKRFILTLLLMMFLMESTWAAAAQYCRHELGIAAQHFGHHTHEHKAGDKSTLDQTTLKADDSSKPKADNDCPYCHLGAMKSMLSVVVFMPTATSLPTLTIAFSSYPTVTPRQPERPNWSIAA